MNRPLAWLGMVAAGLVLAAGSFVPLPRHPVADPLMDLAHAPLFAAGAWWWCRRLRGASVAGRVAAALALAALLGGLIEIAQMGTGRTASARDVGADILGAVAGSTLGVAGERAGAARGSLLALALAALLGAWWAPGRWLFDRGRQRWDLPLVASFEDDLELGRWRCEGCRMARDAGHATDGQSSLRVRFKSGGYPGVGLVSLTDWTPYRAVRFDLYVPGSEPLRLRVKIEDAAHDGRSEDCFQRTLDLPPGAHRVEIDLRDVANGPRGRRLDLARLKLWKVFAVRPPTERTIFLDDVRLLNR